MATLIFIPEEPEKPEYVPRTICIILGRRCDRRMYMDWWLDKHPDYSRIDDLDGTIYMQNGDKVLFVVSKTPDCKVIADEYIDMRPRAVV